MKQPQIIVLLAVLVLSACDVSAPVTPARSTPGFTVTPAQFATSTPVPQTPTQAIPTVTPKPLRPDRPAFLAWPLPDYIGLVRISQYPNTPWTWHFLGLNPGYQCPPMFGYLLDLGPRPSWRDGAIPEEQDMAQADPHNFEMVECYATEGAAGANGHEGTDIKAPAGTPVYAAAAGRVLEWRSQGLNSLVVLKHCLGGAWDAAGACAGGDLWYTTYLHIVPEAGMEQDNVAVATGELLGVIYDQTINSHLHFEVGRNFRNYGNYANPWGEDREPWLGCMWSDASRCERADPEMQRTAFEARAAEWSIQTGERTPVRMGAFRFATLRLLETRAAVLDVENRLRVLDGPIHSGTAAADVANWPVAAENVLDFQISARRIAVLDQNHVLWVLEGDLGGEWQRQATDVGAFSLSEHRLGCLLTNGDVLIQDSGPENEWVGVASQALALQVVDNRIAVVDRNHTLYVNEGAAMSQFEQMASNVRAFQVTRDRLAILEPEGRLLVQSGNLRAGWVAQAEAVMMFQLSGDRIWILGEDHRFQSKPGSLYAEWRAVEFPNLIDLVFEGGMPVYVGTGND